MVVASLLGSLTSQATYKHNNDGSGMGDQLTGQVEQIVLLSGAAWGALLLRERNAPARLACAVQLPPDIAGMIDNIDVDELLDDTVMPAEQQLGRAALDRSDSDHLCQIYSMQLRVQDITLGAFVVGYPREAAVDERRRDLLVAFGDSLGLRLYSMRLQQRIERLTSQLAMINRLGQHTTSIHDRQQLLRQITRLIYETLGHDHILLLLIDESHNTVELVHASGAAGEQLLGQGFHEQVGGKGIVRLAGHGEPL
jgi:GAF domain-containing protein